METLYNGGPVMGGTFPALIWASVISAWEEIAAERAAETAAEKAARAEGKDGEGGEEEIYVPETEVESVEPEEAAPGSRSGPGTGSARSAPEAAPEAPRPPNRAAPAAGSPPAEPRRSSAPRPGARDVGRARRAEAPGALDGLGDPDPGAGEDLRPRAVLGRQDQERVAGEVGAVVGEADAERLGQLARPRAEVGRRRAPARGARASPRTPALGSRARISTAAASPSGSATKLSRLWMP